MRGRSLAKQRQGGAGKILRASQRMAWAKSRRLASRGTFSAENFQGEIIKALKKWCLVLKSAFSNGILAGLNQILAEFSRILAELNQVLADSNEILADLNQILPGFSQVLADSNRVLAD
jgi:hypothetical protein